MVVTVVTVLVSVVVVIVSVVVVLVVRELVVVTVDTVVVVVVEVEFADVDVLDDVLVVDDSVTLAVKVVIVVVVRGGVEVVAWLVNKGMPVRSGLGIQTTLLWNLIDLPSKIPRYVPPHGESSGHVSVS